MESDVFFQWAEYMMWWWWIHGYWVRSSKPWEKADGNFHSTPTPAVAMVNIRQYSRLLGTGDYPRIWAVSWICCYVKHLKNHANQVGVMVSGSHTRGPEKIQPSSHTAIWRANMIIHISWAHTPGFCNKMALFIPLPHSFKPEILTNAYGILSCISTQAVRVTTCWNWGCSYMWT